MKTIQVKVEWMTRMSTYLDVEVDEEEFTGMLTEEQKRAAIESKDYQAEDWREEESYDHTVKVVET